MKETKVQTFDELSPIDWLIKLGREGKQPHTLLLDRAEKQAQDLARITAERDALFDIAVRATRAVDEMPLKLKPRATELDHALATLEPELWERVDAAALKG